MSGTDFDRNERASGLEPDLDRDGRGDLTGKRKDGQERTTEQAAARRGDKAEEIRVPVAEERLGVDKREAELGEVRLKKSVTEEQQSVPVDLEREEVHVRERNVDDRPVRPGEDVFKEGTIRVPVRGEEAVVSKEAVVTGEVVVDKQRTTAREQITDTVRKERVEVDEDYGRHRDAFQRHFRQRQGASGRSWEQAEANYRYGHTAAFDDRYRGRKFDEVETDLRRDYETRHGQAGDAWQHLREEIREGWNRARGR